MKQIKKLFAFVLSLTLMQIVAIPAHAIDTVSVWYANTDYVGYTPRSVGGSYYCYAYPGNSQFTTDFYTACSHACEQWNNVLPISIYSASSNYAVNYIYGGKFEKLVESFPHLSEENAGITEVRYHDIEGKVMLSNGTTRNVWRYTTGGRSCVVDREENGTLQGYKRTATHEMGHLFGWEGHSLQKGDVMYPSSTYFFANTLTDRDKNHLLQIYNLYY